ncbi:MAG: glycosyltransferase family 2 protein [Phocaeicola sp.]
MNDKKNTQKLVSIIITCYNDGDYLLECLESALSSTYSNIEIIIIDDCSRDKKTRNILKEIANDRVKIICNAENKGVCYSRDKAIKEALGEYILPLDADDLITTNYVSDAVEILTANDQIAVVATNYVLFGMIDKEVYLEEFSLPKLLKNNIFTNSSVFRKADYSRCGGISQNMTLGYEDWDFWIKLLANGGGVAYLSGFNFKYRIKEPKKSRNAIIIKKKYHPMLFNKLWENNKEVYSRYYQDPKSCFGDVVVIEPLGKKIKRKIAHLISSLVKKLHS